MYTIDKLIKDLELSGDINELTENMTNEEIERDYQEATKAEATEMEYLNDVLQDALTMGLYVSEVDDEFKASYAQYARDNGQSYLVDVPVGAE